MLTNYATSDWYLNSLSSGKDELFEPYLSLTSTHEEILVTTVTVPLKNKENKTEEKKVTLEQGNEEEEMIKNILPLFG